MTRASTLNIVVTGGAGFIGSNLCDRLIQRGHRVVCLDNLVTGRMSNVRPLLNHPRFEFIEHDVVDPIKLRTPIDRIYNLACPASPPHYQRDPIATMKTCVLGAYNVLEVAREKGARALQASTSEVYGDPEIHPQPEAYRGSVNTIGPRACYDEGTGPCNLGNPHEVPVKDIASLVLGQTGSRSQIEHRPLPQDDPKRRQPVIVRARELLGWSPRVALEAGLRTTIDYFSLELST